MPTKNTVKIFIPNTYYHIYNRGWNLTSIYLDEADFRYFEELLIRAFSPLQSVDAKNRPYKNYHSSIHLNAYCLMGNHFHLLVYQMGEHAISESMKSILTSYAMYINKKYKRRGTLFESTFKAVPILKDGQLMHVTRYIHLNHHDYTKWTHSSYRDYLSICRTWIDSAPILELFHSRQAY